MADRQEVGVLAFEFSSADKAAVYLGLTPSTRQSAAKCYHGPITKQGAARARWLLIQAAQHMMRSAGPHGFIGEKLRKRKNHNVALVATARKMATIAWHMLRNRDPYRYAAPRSTETKLAKLRIMATRKRRRAGTPKGAKQPEAYGSGVGTRAIPSVTEACAKEGLPKPKRPSEISAGERRILQRADTKGYFEKVFEPRRVPRKATAQLLGKP